MSKSKKIVRYTLLALALALGITWWVYCQIVYSQLHATVSSAAYIDLAVSDLDAAADLLERMEQFRSLRDTGILITVLAALSIVALIVTEILVKKFKARPKKERKPKAPKPQKAPIAPAKEEAVTFDTPAPAEKPAQMRPPAPIPSVKAAPPAEPVTPPPAEMPAPATEPVEPPPAKVSAPAEPEDGPELPEVSAFVPAPATIGDLELEEKPVFCSQCGKRFDRKPTFCSECGNRF